MSGLLACTGTIWAQNEDPKAMLLEALRQHLSIGQQRANNFPQQGKTDEIVPHGMDLHNQRTVKLEMPMPQHPTPDMHEQTGQHAPMAHAPQATTGMELLRDSIVYYNADMTPTSKIVFTYNADGRCTHEASYFYDGQIPCRQPSQLYEYEWNAEGQLVIQFSGYEQGGTLVLNNKWEYTYDENGNQTSFVVYYWDYGAWVPSSKDDLAYDEQGRQTYYACSAWQDDQWITQNLLECAYDDHGRYIYYAFFYWNGYQLVGSYKYEYNYDEWGHRTWFAYYNWDREANDWYGYPTTGYTYDERGNITSDAQYEWRDGKYVVVSKYEYTYDEEGYQLSFTYSSLNYNNEWVVSDRTKREYSYDDNGIRIGFMEYGYLAEYDVWYEKSRYEWTYDAAGNRTSELRYVKREGNWNEFSKIDWTYEAAGHMLSEVYSDWNTWINDWEFYHKYEYSYDEYGYQNSYMYSYWTGSAWHDESKYIYTNRADGTRIASENYTYNSASDSLEPQRRSEELYDEKGRYVGYKNYKWSNDDWAMTNGNVYSYDNAGRETGYASYQEQKTWGNDLKLSLKLAKTSLVETMDEEDLLFTGEGFKINTLYVDEFVPAETGTEVDPTERVLWQNDGSLGYTYWDGSYRFASEDYSTGQECYAFPMDVWNKLKTETFYVDMECNDNTTIRVTTSWWSTTLTDNDIYMGSEYLQANADGTWTLAVNLLGSAVSELMDQQHLIFTGENYRILRIRGEEKQAGEWIRHELWQNDGSAEFDNWDSVYRFGKEGHEADCIATFGEEDWNLIKTGTLGADIEVIEPRTFIMTITTGQRSNTFDTVGYGSPCFSADTIMVLAGANKWERTYDEQGNETSYSTFHWNWQTRDWSLSQITVYYYSEHETDVQTAVSDVRSRLGKGMHDGKVIIVVGDKAYTLSGELVK